MMKRVRILLLGLLVMALPAMAWATSTLSQTEIRVSEQAEQVVLYIDKPLKYKTFILDNPARLVIDLSAVKGGANARLPENYNGSLIRDIRFGQFNATTSRLVVDLADSAKINRHFALKQPNRVVVEISSTRAGATQADNIQEETEAPPAAAAKITKGKKPETEKPLIVIDSGHGGVDPGAIADDGRYEKNITLDYAKALRDRLLDTGRYRVLLTRSDDRFIILRERVKIARKAKADMFISLHADSAPNEEARGLSVHTLSEVASDKEAEALAAQENKVDIIYGMDLSKEKEEVADILIDLAQRETRNKSSELARAIVGLLDGKVALLPRAHRFAGFAVLKAPDMPSVLVELGFLTNSRDSALLGTAKHKEKVTTGIVRAIDAYFKKHPKQ